MPALKPLTPRYPMVSAAPGPEVGGDCPLVRFTRTVSVVLLPVSPGHCGETPLRPQWLVFQALLLPSQVKVVLIGRDWGLE